MDRQTVLLTLLRSPFVGRDRRVGSNSRSEKEEKQSNFACRWRERISARSSPASQLRHHDRSGRRSTLLVGGRPRRDALACEARRDGLEPTDVGIGAGDDEVGAQTERGKLLSRRIVGEYPNSSCTRHELHRTIARRPVACIAQGWAMARLLHPLRDQRADMCR